MNCLSPLPAFRPLGLLHEKGRKGEGHKVGCVRVKSRIIRFVDLHPFVSSSVLYVPSSPLTLSPSHPLPLFPPHPPPSHCRVLVMIILASRPGSIFSMSWGTLWPLVTQETGLRSWSMTL